MSDEHIRRANQLGDAPIDPEYRARMNTIAAALDNLFNGDVPSSERKTGFVLLVFPFGEDQHQRCNFISNGADRKDIVELFKEMIARFSAPQPVKGHRK